MPSDALWRHRTPTGTYLGDELAEPSLSAELRHAVLGFREHVHALAVFTQGRFRATYRAQALGLLWPIANPTILMIVMSVVFGVVFPTSVEAYPVFLMLGLVPWHFLSHAWTDGTSCFLQHSEIIKRTSVPPYVVVAGTVLSHVLNLGFASLSLLPLIAVYPEAFKISFGLLLLPLVIALLIVLAFGVALFSAVLNVVYRDVGYIVNSALVVLFWATPIVYPLEQLPGRAHSLMLLNPMASLLSCVREIVMHGRFPKLELLGVAAATSLSVLALALFLYRRFSREVADHV